MNTSMNGDTKKMEQIRMYRAKMLDKPDTWVYGGYYEVNGEAVILHESQGNLMQHTAVDPKTVGQCTGRKSKSGKDIYQGDNVKANWYPYTEMTVEWLPEGRWNISGYTNSKGLTITGNIHDNGQDSK